MQRQDNLQRLSELLENYGNIEDGYLPLQGKYPEEVLDARKEMLGAKLISLKLIQRGLSDLREKVEHQPFSEDKLDILEHDIIEQIKYAMKHVNHLRQLIIAERIELMRMEKPYCHNIFSSRATFFDSNPPSNISNSSETKEVRSLRR